jgi:hypothetical protein
MGPSVIRTTLRRTAHVNFSGGAQPSAFCAIAHFNCASFLDTGEATSTEPALTIAAPHFEVLDEISLIYPPDLHQPY